jgi:drug/metabolite transporter (DMT)-like permease
MTPPRTVLLTAVAMIAFAANSLLCRQALLHTAIDPASFTTVRLVSGALMLWALTRAGRAGREGAGNGLSALCLFTYAAAFSFAYVSLPAATGALLLFGSVQASMIGAGLWRGERLHRVRIAGLLLAGAGLVVLLLPGLAAPPLAGALLMVLAGAAWGAYSLRGRGAGNPLAVTAGNFLRASLLAVLLLAARRLFDAQHAAIDGPGAAYAAASGALASGLGYSIWYRVLPQLKATVAAAVQLSVPVITALGGLVLLAEPLTLRLALASAAILGGIALVVQRRWGAG